MNPSPHLHGSPLPNLHRRRRQRHLLIALLSFLFSAQYTVARVLGEDSAKGELSHSS